MSNFSINFFNMFYLPIFNEFKAEVVEMVEDGDLPEDKGLTLFINSELNDNDKLTIMKKVEEEAELGNKLDKETIEFAIIDWLEEKFETYLS